VKEPELPQQQATVLVREDGCRLNVQPNQVKAWIHVVQVVAKGLLQWCGVKPGGAVGSRQGFTSSSMAMASTPKNSAEMRNDKSGVTYM